MSESGEDRVEEAAEASTAAPGEPGAATRARKKHSFFDRDLTQGSIVRDLWALALPAVGENVMNMLTTTIDMIWVGRLGARPLAAVGVAGTLLMLLMSARMGLTTGTRALISRFFGAGDIEGANHIALQAFILSFSFALILATTGIVFAEQLLGLFGLEPALIAEGKGYLQVAFVGSGFLSFRMMINGILQASGDTLTPMKITLLVRIIHVTTDPFLIFGWAGLPRFGLVGAALANVLAQFAGTSLGFYILFSGYSRLRITLKNFFVDFSILWRIIRIGIPASINSMERSLAQAALLGIVASFGTYAVAAYAVRNRVLMLLMSLGWGGLAMAAAVMVGQNLGAHEPERAERSAWAALGFYWLILAVGAVLFLLLPEVIARFFNTDPEFVGITSTWLMISVAGFPLMPPALLLAQVLGAGAGDTIAPLIISLVSVWGCELPLAGLLPRITDWGVYGVAWAMAIAMGVRGLAMLGWFQTGRWKRRRV